MRIHECGGADKHLDIVPSHLVVDDLDFSFDDVIGAEGQVFHRDVLFHAVTRAIQAALVESGEIEDGFAKGFAGDRAGIGADAADDQLCAR